MPRITAITPTEKGLDADTANHVFDQIARFAGYGFNKSHAAAYAAISYQTAWLKAHHPEAFFAAAMNFNMDKVTQTAVFVNEARQRNIPIWTPSINQSRARFEPVRLKAKWRGHDYGILYALSAIRGVGETAAAEILRERQAGGAFRDIQDVITRTRAHVNRGALVALAKAGAFDCLGIDRATALATVDAPLQAAGTGQMSMFDMMAAAPVVEVKALSRDEILNNEYDVLGHYMSGHPLDHLVGRLDEYRLRFNGHVMTSAKPLRKARMAGVLVDSQIKRTNGGDVMAILTMSDPEGTYEALAFGDTVKDIRHLLKKKSHLLLDVSVSLRDEERRLMIDKLAPLTLAMVAEAA